MLRSAATCAPRRSDMRVDFPFDHRDAFQQFRFPLRVERLVLAEQNITHMPVRTVDPLRGVNNRTPLERDPLRSAATFEFARTRRTGIGRPSSIVSPFCHSRCMAAYPSCDAAAGCSFPLIRIVTGGIAGVREPVQVAGNGIVSGPAGNPDLHRECAGLLGIHRQLDLARSQG